MKLQKIIAVSLMFCTIFSFTSCGNDPEKLAWEGYENKPFAEFLKDFITKMDNEADVNIRIEEGWNTYELNEDDAKEPYTYIIEGEKINTFRFYMDVNDDNLLVAKGYHLIQDNVTSYFFNEERTNEELQEYLKIIKK